MKIEVLINSQWVNVPLDRFVSGNWVRFTYPNGTAGLAAPGTWRNAANPVPSADHRID